MTDYTTPPAHTFLTAREVFARYRWGRSKGDEAIRTNVFRHRQQGTITFNGVGAFGGRGGAPDEVLLSTAAL